ncbi:MAG: hypothetical protein ACREMG_03505 [Gemmatimonadales bacterium]
MTARWMQLLAGLAGAAAVMAAPGCSSSPSGPNYDPQIPASWAGVVTNPFFPLVPGTTYTYESQTSEGLETNTVEVLQATKMVNGVAATEVHDQVYLDGELKEDTYDWYAQDSETADVWYLGEDTKELENGQVVSTAGSWEWGVNGALPGIVMWSDPTAHVGEAYRQEFAEGEAEDWAKVVALDQSVDVPHGSFTGCLETEDWNDLDSGPHEHKFYCPQIGTTLEVGGGGERTELVDVTP